MPNETSEQGKLLKKVVNIAEVRAQDVKTGQQKLFGTVDEFAPGFSEWAGMMNTKLSNSQKENEELKQAIRDNTAQSKRLVNSIERIIPKFELSVSQERPDLIVSPYDETHKADVALVSSSLPAEAEYPFSVSQLAEPIGIHASRLGILFSK